MGRLNKKDKNAFELKLKNNADLAGEVKLRREMISGLEAYGRQSLKDELKVIHKAVIRPTGATAPAQKRRRFLPFIAAAASILILVFALFKFNDKAVSQNPDDLYASYFTPYELTVGERSTGVEEIIQMKQLFNDEKYSEALPLLNAQLATLNPKPSNLLLAAGIAQLESGHPEKALEHFQEITANKDFNFEDEVSWYSALAYLKMKDINAARKSLSPLTSDASADHHKKAKILLRKLEDQ